jgi:hypothetical protein
MVSLELTSYRRKGINAYLLMVGADIATADYGTPKTEADQAKAHTGKSHAVVIDLSAKPDGNYKYKEANGHKTRYGYLSIKDGEIVQEFESEQEMLSATLPGLPELEGTEKQIAWAEKIRAKFIDSIGDRITDWSPQSAAYAGLEKITQAKSWIDNRDRLNPEKFIEKVAELEREWELAEEAENLYASIEAEKNKSQTFRDDDALNEVEAYAIVYSDRIEVTANETGMGDRIPKGRKYVGGKGDMRWEYSLDRLPEILACSAISFVLNEKGERVDENE